MKRICKLGTLELKHQQQRNNLQGTINDVPTDFGIDGFYKIYDPLEVLAKEGRLPSTAIDAVTNGVTQYLNYYGQADDVVKGQIANYHYVVDGRPRVKDRVKIYSEDELSVYSAQNQIFRYQVSHDPEYRWQGQTILVRATQTAIVTTERGRHRIDEELSFSRVPGRHLPLGALHDVVNHYANQYNYRILDDHTLGKRDVDRLTDFSRIIPGTTHDLSNEYWLHEQAHRFFQGARTVFGVVNTAYYDSTLAKTAHQPPLDWEQDPQ